jgi:hypothetical protein
VSTSRDSDLFCGTPTKPQRYRTELRELNEVNFPRFDARLELMALVGLVLAIRR